jgi:hypothetical protein
VSHNIIPPEKAENIIARWIFIFFLCLIVRSIETLAWRTSPSFIFAEDKLLFVALAATKQIVDPLTVDIPAPLIAQILI